jgi:predicted RNA binding protein YcfA (HicA-like mRNA interferase family)
LKQVSGKELASAIQGKGWVFARVKGSHHIFTKEGRRERIQRGQELIIDIFF